MKTPFVQLDHLHVFGLESGPTLLEKGGGFPLPPSRFHRTTSMTLPHYEEDYDEDTTVVRIWMEVGVASVVDLYKTINWSPTRARPGPSKTPNYLGAGDATSPLCLALSPMRATFSNTNAPPQCTTTCRSSSRP